MTRELKMLNLKIDQHWLEFFINIQEFANKINFFHNYCMLRISVNFSVSHDLTSKKCLISVTYKIS